MTRSRDLADNAENAKPKIVDAKGDLIVGTAADAASRLAVGSNDQVLTADSSTATGLKWATPSAGSLTLLSTTSLSGLTTTISSINQTYTHLYVLMRNATTSTAADPRFKPNGNGVYTTLIRNTTSVQNNTAGKFSDGGQTSYPIAVFTVFDYADTTSPKTVQFSSYQSTSANMGTICNPNSAAITSIDFQLDTGTWTAGTVYVYGVK